MLVIFTDLPYKHPFAVDNIFFKSVSYIRIVMNVKTKTVFFLYQAVIMFISL